MVNQGKYLRSTLSNGDILKQLEQIWNSCERSWSLSVAPSTIPNAGLGVFINISQRIPPYHVVALYPGVVYSRYEVANILLHYWF